mmetsp:Transcript_30217/g.99974  ORF Transcript_30217/g.99974 Transcript_30217/m.99974 type:complete len:87 (-) Transcript_30217:121-381(-)
MHSRARNRLIVDDARDWRGGARAPSTRSSSRVVVANDLRRRRGEELRHAAAGAADGEDEEDDLREVALLQRLRHIRPPGLGQALEP